MFGKGNDLIIPALLGLGLFANANEMNLANNTSILLILFLLLKGDMCGHGDGGHHGGELEFRGSRGVRAVRTARGDIIYVPDVGPDFPPGGGWDGGHGCPPKCCNPCGVLGGIGRFDGGLGGCNPCSNPLLERAIEDAVLDKVCRHRHHDDEEKECRHCRRREREEEREERRRRHEREEERRRFERHTTETLERVERCACHRRHHHRDHDEI